MKKRFTGLLLAGAAIPTIAMSQPVIARDQNAPIVIAQKNQDQDKNDNNQDKGKKQQRQENRQKPQGNSEQRQDQRQGQPQERRDQKQEQRQQRQDTQKGEREERQNQRQEQKQQRRDTQKGQQDQKDGQPQQDQQNRRGQQQDQQRQKEQSQDQQNKDRQKSDQRQGSEPVQRQDGQRQDGQRQDGQRQDDKRQGGQQRQDDRRQGGERQDSGDRQQGRDNREGRDNNARKMDDVRGERRERKEGNRTVIQEGNRTIVREGNRTFIRRDESDRLRRVGRDVNVQRVGNETRTVVVGPSGQRIVTVTDANGRLLRRSRFVNNREVIIIDNRPRGGRRADAFFVALPALAIASLALPRDRYIVEAEGAPPEYIYGALMAPPVEALPRAYTLDEIRYSPEVRDRMPRIDLDTITFDLGSWEIAPDQYNRLAPIAEGIRRAIAKNPDEVFLIEGHTDATGNDDDNLSLSDRRAEAASIVLTNEFQIPPENLTTQGYGSQQMKIPSQGAERANRRVTVRRITPLLQQGQAAGAPPQ